MHVAFSPDAKTMAVRSWGWLTPPGGRPSIELATEKIEGHRIRLTRRRSIFETKEITLTGAQGPCPAEESGWCGPEVAVEKDFAG